MPPNPKADVKSSSFSWKIQQNCRKGPGINRSKSRSSNRTRSKKRILKFETVPIRNRVQEPRQAKVAKAKALNPAARLEFLGPRSPYSGYNVEVAGKKTRRQGQQKSTNRGKSNIRISKGQVSITAKSKSRSRGRCSSRGRGSGRSRRKVSQSQYRSGSSRRGGSAVKGSVKALSPAARIELLGSRSPYLGYDVESAGKKTWREAQQMSKSKGKSNTRISKDESSIVAKSRSRSRGRDSSTKSQSRSRGRDSGTKSQSRSRGRDSGTKSQSRCRGRDSGRSKGRNLSRSKYRSGSGRRGRRAVKGDVKWLKSRSKEKKAIEKQIQASSRYKSVKSRYMSRGKKHVTVKDKSVIKESGGVETRKMFSKRKGKPKTPAKGIDSKTFSTSLHGDRRRVEKPATEQKLDVAEKPETTDIEKASSSSYSRDEIKTVLSDMGISGVGEDRVAVLQRTLDEKVAEVEAKYVVTSFQGPVFIERDVVQEQLQQPLYQDLAEKEVVDVSLAAIRSALLDLGIQDMADDKLEKIRRKIRQMTTVDENDDCCDLLDEEGFYRTYLQPLAYPRSYILPREKYERPQTDTVALRSKYTAAWGKHREPGTDKRMALRWRVRCKLLDRRVASVVKSRSEQYRKYRKHQLKLLSTILPPTYHR